MIKSHAFPVTIESGRAEIDGDLIIPEKTKGIVLFAHGSGSSRFSPRNQYVAKFLNEKGFATLLIDLLTHEEEKMDSYDGRYRFDIPLLSTRLTDTTEWVGHHPLTADLKIGYFGASTGAAAALVAAPEFPGIVEAVVSRGGRPDMAGDALPRVQAPVLLIVGGSDPQVLELNEAALEKLGSRDKKLKVVPDATHLFEEPGALEKVAKLSAAWFLRYMRDKSHSHEELKSVTYKQKRRA